MSIVPLHAGARYPLPLDVAGLVLGVGVLVFLLVAYDFYRQHRDAW